MKDLLGIDVDVTAFLPPDTISHGFDNVADAQRLLADVDGGLPARGQPDQPARGRRSQRLADRRSTYKIRRTASQMRHVEGAPMGTRGGMSVVHVFPADGDYVFKLMLHYEPLGGLFGRSTLSVWTSRKQIEVSVNGERVALIDSTRA